MITKKPLISSIFLCLWNAQALGEITTLLEVETAFNQQKSNTEKNEVLLRSEWEKDWAELSFLLPSLISKHKIIASMNADTENNLSNNNLNYDNYSSANKPLVSTEKNGSYRLNLDEAYIDGETYSLSWRLGKQQVVWGQADGLKVLDVINPQNYREFNLDDFQSSRIATWMLNVEWLLENDDALQVLLIPDMTFNQSAAMGSDFEITSRRLSPSSSLSNNAVAVNIEDKKKPDSSKEIELALRWSGFYSGWDVTLNYFQHYHDDVVIFREIVSPQQLSVRPEYKFSRLYGLSANNAFGDWVLRLEAGYQTHRYTLRQDLAEQGIHSSPEFSSVTGLDYQGISNWLISYQWFHTHLLTGNDNLSRERNRQQHSLLLRWELLNDTLKIENFVLFSDEDNDGQWRSEVSYNMSDEMDIWLGYDGFYGNRQGVFGQFVDNDRWLAGFKYGF